MCLWPLPTAAVSAAVLVCAVAATAVDDVSPSDDAPPGDAAPSVASAPAAARTLDLTRMTYVGSADEQSEIVIAAKEARVLPEREQVLLASVDLTLAAIETSGALELRCDHGELDLESGDFVGVGNVRGRTPDGRRFETERLHYAHELGLVTSDAPVVIREGSSAIRGGGLSYQVRQGRLQLLGGATVVQGP